MVLVGLQYQCFLGYDCLELSFAEPPSRVGETREVTKIRLGFRVRGQGLGFSCTFPGSSVPELHRGPTM